MLTGYFPFLLTFKHLNKTNLAQLRRIRYNFLAKRKKIITLLMSRSISSLKLYSASPGAMWKLRRCVSFWHKKARDTVMCPGQYLKL